MGEDHNVVFGQGLKVNRAIVRVDIPTRSVKVSSPKWEDAKLRRDGCRPSSG